MASQDQASQIKSGLGNLVIFVKDLRNPNNRKRKLTVKTYSSVKDVKDILASHLHIPVMMQRLFFRGRELRNARTLHDSGINISFQTIFFALYRESTNVTWSLSPYDSLQTPKSLSRIINQVKRGLACGISPVLAIDGTGGTYFMFDTCKRKIAAFKPKDEEPFALNNPRGFISIGSQQVSMRQGIEPGEACIREVAAYLCDEKQFHCVPATTLVEARHPSFCYHSGPEKMKLGSFQEFVHHSEVVADISPSKLSTREVHKIAILDIRLLNGDRNDANILVCRPSSLSPKCKSTIFREKSEEITLIPIDHGYCLPDIVEIGWCDWCWLDWPQIKKPLDKETKNYVLSLNPKDDAEQLGCKLSFREPCLRNFRAAEMLLVTGVSAGLTLYDIANIVVRHDLEEKSELEIIMRRAKELARAALYNTFNSKTPHRKIAGAAFSYSFMESEESSTTADEKISTAVVTSGRKNENFLHYGHNHIIEEDECIQYEDESVGLPIEDEGFSIQSPNGEGQTKMMAPAHDRMNFDAEHNKTCEADTFRTNLLNSHRPNSNGSIDSIKSNQSSCDSPLGFWQVRMEDVDKRNAESPYIPWSEPKSPTNGDLSAQSFPQLENEVLYTETDDMPSLKLILEAELAPISEIHSEVQPSCVDEKLNCTHHAKNEFPIVRSFSYHGFRSEALYDSPERARGPRKLPHRYDENSEEFKEKFFNLLDMLIQETIRKVQRQKKASER